MNNETLNKLKPFLYGKLLGDANLEKLSYGRRESRLKLEHSTKQKEYLLHCYNRIHNFCNKPFDRIRKLIYKNEVKVYKTSLLQSKRLKAFTQLLNLWYSDKKILPQDLEEFFTVETLAYWYMDDGYVILQTGVKVQTKSMKAEFCTDSFSELEVDRLINIINSKFNLDATKFKSKDIYRIRIGKKEKVLEFFNLVEPYIVDCLRYKIRTVK